MIHIAGLGPGDPGSITLETSQLLKDTRVVLRTAVHPTVESLRDWGIAFVSLDHSYIQNDSFEQVYQTIAREVLRLYREQETDLTFCVPGNPLIAERSVTELISLLEEEGVPYRIYPAVSFIDTIMDVLRRDPVRGLLILDAADLTDKGLSAETDTVITQVYNRRIASEVKLALSDYLDDEDEVIYIRNAGIKDQENIRRIPLWSLDRQADVDHLTTVFVEREQVKPGFQAFKKTIDTLRGPGGCPWDREQTHESLRRYLIEEAYETVDAITEGDMDDVREELGDVLLQVFLHARIAQENGDFTIHDVIRTVNEKMISRHPHVFGELELADSAQVLDNWEKLKKTEKGDAGLSAKLDKIPKSVPSVMRAAEVAKKAQAYGHAKPDRAELMGRLKALLSDEGPSTAKEAAELTYLSVLLADEMGLQMETLLQERVDHEIIRLKKIDENR